LKRQPIASAAAFFVLAGALDGMTRPVVESVPKPQTPTDGIF